MKRFDCSCGNQVFFENSECTACGATLGFAPLRLSMVTLRSDDDDIWFDSDGIAYRQCRNRIEHNNCNWLLQADEAHEYCVSCRLNRTIPNLSSEQNREYWARIELAKRRLIYSLLVHKLPVERKTRSWPQGLLFDFKADKSLNPTANEWQVYTGHRDGIITLNIAEADDVFRAMQRKNMNESYRTLLGHFRHESGHYYYDFLIDDEAKQTQFQELFGDAQSDYGEALNLYYQNGPPPGWEMHYISAYCTAHPSEDWAESWAHYLHMAQSLETAGAYGLVEFGGWDDDFDKLVDNWPRFTVVHNDLNRAMGLRDAYPFVFSTAITEKLRFIHQLLRARAHSI